MERQRESNHLLPSAGDNGVKEGGVVLAQENAEGLYAFARHDVAQTMVSWCVER